VGSKVGNFGDMLAVKIALDVWNEIAFGRTAFASMSGALSRSVLPSNLGTDRIV
jgi:hypothetical protein